MTPFVFMLVLLSASIHVFWNALVKKCEDKASFAWLTHAVSVFVFQSRSPSSETCWVRGVRMTATRRRTPIAVRHPQSPLPRPGCSGQSNRSSAHSRSPTPSTARQIGVRPASSDCVSNAAHAHTGWLAGSTTQRSRRGSGESEVPSKLRPARFSSHRESSPSKEPRSLPNLCRSAQ